MKTLLTPEQEKLKRKVEGWYRRLRKNNPGFIDNIGAMIDEWEVKHFVFSENGIFCAYTVYRRYFLNEHTCTDQHNVKHFYGPHNWFWNKVCVRNIKTGEKKETSMSSYGGGPSFDESIDWDKYITSIVMVTNDGDVICGTSPDGKNTKEHKFSISQKITPTIS